MMNSSKSRPQQLRPEVLFISSNTLLLDSFRQYLRRNCNIWSFGPECHFLSVSKEWHSCAFRLVLTCRVHYACVEVHKLACFLLRCGAKLNSRQGQRYTSVASSVVYRFRPAAPAKNQEITSDPLILRCLWYA